MIKVMALGKRKPGMTQEEYSKHWREVHAPLTVKFMHQLGIKRYIQNHIINQPDAPEPGFDGIAEVWFENMEGFKAFMNFWTSEAGKVIRDDEDRFMDRSTIKFVFVEENIVL